SRVARDAEEPVRASRSHPGRVLRRMARDGRVTVPARRRALVLSLLLTLSLAPACGSSSTGETVLRFSAIGREGEVVSELVPEFERAHPGLRVQVQQLPWTAAHEKLLTAVVGGTAPDLCQLGNTWMPEFVAVRALAPLDARLRTSSVVRAEDY